MRVLRAASAQDQGNFLDQSAAVHSGRRTFGAMLTGEGPACGDVCDAS
jgi:hypothetical protein